MSQKRRASKAEQFIIEREQAAFLAWRETLSDEQYQALFMELCTRLARLGYLAPPPAGLWSLPQEEQEPYLQAFQDAADSDRWLGVSMAVRELWLETIGVLEPESQNQATIEQEEEPWIAKQ